MIIAIDGPAGSGKSTVSKRLAKQLNFCFLDTGAMYRAMTYAVKRAGIAWNDVAAIVVFVNQTKLSIESDTGNFKVLINGEDVTLHIREPEVTNAVKFVAPLKEVRQKLVAIQQAYGKEKNIVVEGRDTTTVVFPDADLKIYLDGNQEERAKRRYEELTSNGIQITFEEVLKDQIKRDESDQSRKESPLLKAKDAVILDTTGLSIDQVVSKILTFIPSDFR